MRLTVVAAVCLSMVGLAVAADAQAAMVKMPTNIPAQGLGPALKTLAKDRGFQVVFRTEVVGSARTHGASGDLTTPEALTKLLEGTNLAYSFLDENTVTIVSRADSESGSAVTPQNGNLEGGDKKEGQKRDSFRVAQVDQRPSSGSDSVAAAALNSREGASASPGLSEIVVTAQKKSERLQDVPVPVSVLDASTLTDTGQVLLRDYYTTVPSFVVQPGIESQQILAIRGIGTGAGGGPGPTVGVVVDDIPFGGSTGASGAFWLPDFDPGDLQRIEVLRGPQGTLYGADSMGGLLKLVTKDPSMDAYSASFQAGTSSVRNGAQPGFEVRSSVNLPVSSTFAIRASGFRRQDPGYIDNPGNCDGTACAPTNGVNVTQTDGAHLAALWQPSETVSLKVSALYQHSQANASSDIDSSQYNGPTGLSDLQQNAIPNTGGYNKTAEAFSAILKAKLGSLDLISLTGYGINHIENSLDFTYIFAPLVNLKYGVTGAPFSLTSDTSTFTQEIRLSGKLADHFEWLIGGFYSHDHDPQSYAVNAENATTGSISGNYLAVDNGLRTFEEYAGFADLTYHVTDQFNIQFGARESQVNQYQGPEISTGPFIVLTQGVSTSTAPAQSARESSFTYLVTPQFKLSQDLMIYARFASGFRPGASNGPIPISEGAPAQSSPDKTENYELGFKADLLEHRLFLDASIYHIDWKDMQISLATVQTSAEYTANAGSAKSDGAEFSAEARPMKGLTLDAWVAYDHAVLTEAFPVTSTAVGASGDKLPDTPRWSGHLSFQQEFPLWTDTTGYLGAQVSYVGDRQAGFVAVGQQRLDMPSYSKVDLRTGFNHDSWTVNLYANNVADKRGLLNGGPGADPPYGFAYITPRTVGVTVTKTF